MTEDSSRGARAAGIGAVLGLVAAAGLGLLSFYNSTGPPSVEVVGALSLGLLYASPYLATLMISRVRSAGARGGLLVPIGLLSLAASLSSMSLVTLAFLPATYFIWLAVARSLAASARPLTSILPAAAGGAVVAAAIVSGFFALLLVQDDDARCWALLRDEDGHRRWESVPNVSARPGGLSPGPASGPSVRNSCISDVVTTTEAAISIGLVASALLGSLVLSRLRWPDSPPGNGVSDGDSAQ